MAGSEKDSNTDLIHQVIDFLENTRTQTRDAQRCNNLKVLDGSLSRLMIPETMEVYSGERLIERREWEENATRALIILREMGERELVSKTFRNYQSVISQRSRNKPLLLKITS